MLAGEPDSAVDLMGDGRADTRRLASADLGGGNRQRVQAIYHRLRS